MFAEMNHKPRSGHVAFVQAINSAAVGVVNQVEPTLDVIIKDTDGLWDKVANGVRVKRAGIYYMEWMCRDSGNVARTGHAQISVYTGSTNTQTVTGSDYSTPFHGASGYRYLQAGDLVKASVWAPSGGYTMAAGDVQGFSFVVAGPF